LPNKPKRYAEMEGGIESDSAARSGKPSPSPPSSAGKGGTDRREQGDASIMKRISTSALLGLVTLLVDNRL
jgi:hypothetical protein